MRTPLFPKGFVESPVLGNGHAGFGRRPGDPHGNIGRALRVDLTTTKANDQSPPPSARRRTNVLYALIRDNRTWQPDSPQITESAA
jgi:hypothetical protein